MPRKRIRMGKTPDEPVQTGRNRAHPGPAGRLPRKPRAMAHSNAPQQGRGLNDLNPREGITTPHLASPDRTCRWSEAPRSSHGDYYTASTSTPGPHCDGQKHRDPRKGITTRHDHRRRLCPCWSGAPPHATACGQRPGGPTFPVRGHAVRPLSPLPPNQDTSSPLNAGVPAGA